MAKKIIPSGVAPPAPLARLLPTKETKCTWVAPTAKPCNRLGLAKRDGSWPAVVPFTILDGFDAGSSPAVSLADALTAPIKKMPQNACFSIPHAPITMDELTITKKQLRAVLLCWAQAARDGKCISHEQADALPVEQEADASTEHVWRELQAQTAGRSPQSDLH